jgi:hypothetical protein
MTPVSGSACSVCTQLPKLAALVQVEVGAKQETQNERACARKLLCSMYISRALLYAAVLAWIRSRASGAVTMDLPARWARLTMVTRGLAASGGGGLASASPGATTGSRPKLVTEGSCEESVKAFKKTLQSQMRLRMQRHAPGTCALPQVADPALHLCRRQIPHASLPLGPRHTIGPAKRTKQNIYTLFSMDVSMTCWHG